MVEDQNNITIRCAIEHDDPDIKYLITGARDHLVQSRAALRCLAKMTLGVSEDEAVDVDEFVKRMGDIKTYLHSCFPTVKLAILPKCYAETPEPSTIIQYRDSGPWLAKSVKQRQSMRLEISLNQLIIELFKAKKPSVHNQHIRFFLQVVIIHELAHVVMFIFATQPTLQKFCGYNSLKRNPLGVDRTNRKVPRGELPGDHVEVAMIGGNMSLAIPVDRDIFDVEPEVVVVVIRTSENKCRVIRSDTPNLATVIEDWEFIGILTPVQQYPPTGYCPVKLKLSETNDASTTSSSRPPSSISSFDYYMPFHPNATPTPEGVKR